VEKEVIKRLNSLLGDSSNFVSEAVNFREDLEVGKRYAHFHKVEDTGRVELWGFLKVIEIEKESGMIKFLRYGRRNVWPVEIQDRYFGIGNQNENNMPADFLCELKPRTYKYSEMRNGGSGEKDLKRV